MVILTSWPVMSAFEGLPSCWKRSNSKVLVWPAVSTTFVSKSTFVSVVRSVLSTGMMLLITWVLSTVRIFPLLTSMAFGFVVPRTPMATSVASSTPTFSRSNSYFPDFPALLKVPATSRMFPAAGMAKLRTAEMEERREQPARQEQQGDEAADAVEQVRVLYRHEAQRRIALAGEQRQEQTLAHTDQGGEENNRECRMHG